MFTFANRLSTPWCAVAAEIVVVLIELDFCLSLICLTFPHAVEGEHDLNQGPAAGFAGALIDAPII